MRAPAADPERAKLPVINGEAVEGGDPNAGDSNNGDPNAGNNDNGAQNNNNCVARPSDCQSAPCQGTCGQEGVNPPCCP